MAYNCLQLESVESYMERDIPEPLGVAYWSDDWKEIPIDPISDSSDPLVPLGPFSDYDNIFTSSVYAGEHTNSPYIGGLANSLLAIFVRQSVAERLRWAQSLLPSHLQLLVFDGYRPLELQQALFDGYIDALRELKPDADESSLLIETQNFVSLPSTDPVKPSPHTTGGSVDVAIFDSSDRNPRMLDFGSPFDYGQKEAHLRHLETDQLQRGLDEAGTTALGNRRLLYRVMDKVGMQAFPGEWWHFNAPETQMGAKIAGLALAHFGPAIFGPEQQAFEDWRRRHQALGKPTFLPPAAIIRPGI